MRASLPGPPVGAASYISSGLQKESKWSVLVAFAELSRSDRETIAGLEVTGTAENGASQTQIILPEETDTDRDTDVHLYGVKMLQQSVLQLSCDSNLDPD
ncbi:hypothetical protein CB1_000995020 [Camelus ferus]|nr:hypothetical protein CB1_000995020 [Camelus ferus]